MLGAKNVASVQNIKIITEERTMVGICVNGNSVIGFTFIESLTT
jgi:hypothetical protein